MARECYDQICARVISSWVNLIYSLIVESRRKMAKATRKAWRTVRGLLRYYEKSRWRIERSWYLQNYWGKKKILICLWGCDCGWWIRITAFSFQPIFLSLFILRESEWEHEGGAERERERENLKQVPLCQCRARCGAQTHKPWDHDLSPNQESEA